MKLTIEKYIRCVVDKEFLSHTAGVRHQESSKYFHLAIQTIHHMKVKTDHEQTVLDHIFDQYGDLTGVGTERIHQSLTRLPQLLKTFLYVTSAIALMTFIIMPFASVVYSFFVVVTLTFVLAMIIQLIEDLDNPFVGYWNISHEPFDRAYKHIAENY